MSKLITVFGATGNQGGSVIRTILSHPRLASEYKIRAVTRDPSKGTSLKLKDQGCEVVKADQNDPGALKDAIAGSYAVFAVTNYWEHQDHEKELANGKNIADACVATSVKHLVWSSLPNATKISSGNLEGVLHFDSKAAIQEYIEKTKGDMIASYFMPAMFMSTVRGFMRRGPDGAGLWETCMDATHTQLPCIDIVNDTGKWVTGLLDKGEAANGVQVSGVGSWATPEEMTDMVEQVARMQVVFKEISPEAVASAFGHELMENIVLVRDYSYFGTGAEKKQAESDKFLLEGETVTTWKEYVTKTVPWIA